MLLAIETSCDETAIALLDSGALFEKGVEGEEALLADLVSSQINLHEPYGGIVPELAAREHLRNLPVLYKEALGRAGVSPAELRALAVTRGPGLKGCLLVGLSFAKALALSLRIPLLALHHIEGHLVVGELLPLEERPIYPALALVVSGGHTMLVWIDSLRRYEVIARTRDDAAGEAFDKIAMLLQLPYPGGPSLAAAAEDGDSERFTFPRGVAGDPESFSFSGLKTAVLRRVQALEASEGLSSQTVRDLAASSQAAIVSSLVEKTVAACEELKPRSLLLTGGVAANESLRSALRTVADQRSLRFVVPPAKWCTDNAAMIAVLGAAVIKQNPQLYERWNPAASAQNLGPNVPFEVEALPRWPLEEIGGEQASP